MDARRAARLSSQWLILLDGAISVALVSGKANAALDAQAAAQVLLDAARASARVHSLIMQVNPQVHRRHSGEPQSN